LDYYLDNEIGATYKNAVHSDSTFSIGGNPPNYTALYTGDGGLSNKQSIKNLVKGVKVNVPIWVKTSGSYNNATLIPADPNGVTAQKVMAVDSMGRLYSDAAGTT